MYMFWSKLKSYVKKKMNFNDNVVGGNKIANHEC